MNYFKLVFCGLVFLGLPNSGLAQLYIEETFFPVHVKKNDVLADIGGSTTNTIATEAGIGYDFRTTIGYTFTNSIILALSYNLFSVTSSRASLGGEDAIDRTESKSELGPTVGYTLGSWRFLFTYFMTAEKSLKNKLVVSDGTLSTDETFINLDGKGIQIAINYSLNLGGGFEIGPSLIYRSVSYPRQTREVRTGSIPPYTNLKLVTPAIDAELKPMITVVYRY
ncbi:MAG: hypothetical protein SGJ18_07155 [Pseudomonadota bacterium]|nr:hypothetical protein [Pseudomonadota bacterium]